MAVLNTPLPEHHAFEIIVGVLKALRKAGAKSIVIPVAGKLKGISPKHDELVNNPVLTVDSTGVRDVLKLSCCICLTIRFMTLVVIALS